MRGAAGGRFGQPTAVSRLWAAIVLRLLKLASGGPCQGVGILRVRWRCRRARRAAAMASPLCPARAGWHRVGVGGRTGAVRGGGYLGVARRACGARGGGRAVGAASGVVGCGGRLGAAAGVVGAGDCKARWYACGRRGSWCGWLRASLGCSGGRAVSAEAGAAGRGGVLDAVTGVVGCGGMSGAVVGVRSVRGPVWWGTGEWWV